MTFERFVLRTSSRWITVQPFDPAVEHDRVLFFDRRAPHTAVPYSVRDRVDCAALAEPDAERIIFGVVGVITLLVDTYLIVIESREKAGTLFEHDVFRVKSLSAVPLRGPKMLKANRALSKQQLKDEAALRAALLDALSLPGFYFSHAIDLTRPAQKRLDLLASDSPDASAAAPEFLRADLRFVWNRFVGKPLADAGVPSWIVPLICGYFDVREGIVNSKAVRLTLLSRRAADRPGLRFTARGADIHGNVSNFVETEQIITHGDAFASLVQVRGSIPLLWQQLACIKYKAPIQLKKVDAGGKNGLSQMAFKRHIALLLESYGPVTAISLVNSHGAEAVLAGALASAVDMLAEPRLKYVAWDFHQKTKGPRKYSTVDAELVASLDDDLSSYGYFLVADGNTSSPSLRQRGVVRTNCVDSLDRTNVVQSVIAHRVMDDALKHMGVLSVAPESSTVAAFKDFELAFKATWADHADAISIVYAGSGALKTDFTRTGKRTKPGMVQDGYRSAMRYIYNNFWDGRRQDGIDLFLGVVSLDKELRGGERTLAAVSTAPEKCSAFEKVLPFMWGACIIMACGSVILLPDTRKKLTVGGAFLASSVFLLAAIAKNGSKYVQRPSLKGTN